jgi:hypothetical protein
MAAEGKHSFGNIKDPRVTFAQKVLTKTKKYFLKTFLEHYDYEVLIEDKKEGGRRSTTIYCGSDCYDF